MCWAAQATSLPACVRCVQMKVWWLLLSALTNTLVIHFSTVFGTAFLFQPFRYMSVITCSHIGKMHEFPLFSLKHSLAETHKLDGSAQIPFHAWPRPLLCTGQENQESRQYCVGWSWDVMGKCFLYSSLCLYWFISLYIVFTPNVQAIILYMGCPTVWIELYVAIWSQNLE